MGEAKEPYEKKLTDEVVVQYGWKDAHGVVKVQLPMPGKPWLKEEITADMILKFKKNFDDAFTYGSKPEAERDMKEPVQFEIRKDCRGRWGYKDAHVELDFRKALVWLPTVKFTFEEFVLGKKAMDEAHAWASLPEEVRALQGV